MGVHRLTGFLFPDLSDNIHCMFVSDGFSPYSSLMSNIKQTVNTKDRFIKTRAANTQPAVCCSARQHHDDDLDRRYTWGLWCTLWHHKKLRGTPAGITRVSSFYADSWSPCRPECTVTWEQKRDGPNSVMLWRKFDFILWFYLLDNLFSDAGCKHTHTHTHTHRHSVCVCVCVCACVCDENEVSSDSNTLLSVSL